MFPSILRSSFLVFSIVLMASGIGEAQPVNDLCADAVELVIGDPPLASNNDGAGTSAEEPTPSCVFEGLFHTVWFKFSITEPGTYSIESGTDFDDVLSLYSGESCGSLSEIVCHDLRFFNEVITEELAAGTYYVQVASYGQGVTGNINISVGQGFSCGNIINQAESLTICPGQCRTLGVDESTLSLGSSPEALLGWAWSSVEEPLVFINYLQSFLAFGIELCEGSDELNNILNHLGSDSFVLTPVTVANPSFGEPDLTDIDFNCFARGEPITVTISSTALPECEQECLANAGTLASDFPQTFCTTEAIIPQTSGDQTQGDDWFYSFILIHNDTMVGSVIMGNGEDFMQITNNEGSVVEFPPGNYSIFGLSMESSVLNSTFFLEWGTEGFPLSSLQNALAEGRICAALSNESYQISIEECLNVDQNFATELSSFISGGEHHITLPPSTEVNWQLFDMKGQLISKGKMDQTNGMVINNTTLPPGISLIHLRTGHQTYIARLLRY